MPGRLLSALCAMLTAAALLTLTAQPAAAGSGGARWPADMNTCADETAVVVASDPAAQSDVYSAVTLAGVLNTSCLIDAGARDAAMPTASTALLDAANANVWVVGGLAAVPDAKLHGRKIHRVAGADRWATARAAGAIAEQIANGNTPAFATVNAPPAATGFTTVSGDVCGVRVDGSLACWTYSRGRDAWARSDPPVSGKFTDVSGQWSGGCGVRVYGSLACWPRYAPGGGSVRRVEQAVSGKFTDVYGQWLGGCGLRVDGNLACWAFSYIDDGLVSADLPVSGKFTDVSGDRNGGCGLRVDGSLACWLHRVSGGPHGDGGMVVVSVDLPVSGKFTDVSGDAHRVCGLRVDGSLACWQYNGIDWNNWKGLVSVDLPVSGTFTAVSSDKYGGCGLRVDGSLACWRYFQRANRMDRVDPPV